MNKLRKLIHWTITRKDDGKVYITGLLEDGNLETGTYITEELERIDFVERTASTEKEIFELGE